MVRKLIDCGELRETPDEADARSKLLSLTAKGRRTLARGVGLVSGAFGGVVTEYRRTP